MPRPAHFEIHAADPQRARTFYESVFGWTFTPYGDAYWLITTGEEGTPGINGGLLPRRGPAPEAGAPVNAFPVTVEVTDLDEYVKSIENSGGAVAVPKSAVPGVGWLAYVTDPEGNILGLMQPDEKAA
jgi:uncharacterized protein